MSVGELEVGRRFLETLRTAAETGDREPLYTFLAADIEWDMPERLLRGIDEVREQLTWVKPPENLDVEYEEGELRDLGEGRLAMDVHETYRMKTTGDFAYERDLRIHLSVREARITRYEMRFLG